jgi:hypothetical protein
MNKYFLLIAALLISLNGPVFSESEYDHQNFAEFSVSIFQQDKFIRARERCDQYDLGEESKESVECYKREAKKNPTSPEAQYFLGLAYIYSGNLSETQKQYERLTGLSTNFSLLLFDVIAHVQPAWIDEFSVGGVQLVIELVVVMAIYLVIVTFVVQFATKIAAKFKPRYKNAFLVVSLSVVVLLLYSAASGFFTNLVLHMLGEPLIADYAGVPPAVSMLLVAAWIIVQAYLYGLLIKDPNTSTRLGFRRGFIVTLAQVFIIGPIFGVIFGVGMI